MTLISAYIDLFIWGESPGGNVQGGNVRIPNKRRYDDDFQ